MAGPTFNNPKWLREQAARCRALAQDAPLAETKLFLLGLAQEYEADATNLERDPELSRVAA